MADEARTDNATATPPATSGGSDEIADLTARIATLTSQIGELATNQRVLGETVAGQKALTADEVKSLIADGLQSGLAAKAESDAAAAKKKETRAKIIAEKLPGVPAALINLPDSDDEKVLVEAAEKLAAEINALAKPGDQGGAAGEGGKTPAEQKPAAGTPLGGISPGAAAFAAGLKVPAL